MFLGSPLVRRDTTHGRIAIIDRMRRSGHDSVVRATHLGCLLCLCTLAAVSPAHARSGQTATGSVAGQLIDASNGEPIADGVIVLPVFLILVHLLQCVSGI
jgi:hypothetical protein